jgi:hypothetical protein
MLKLCIDKVENGYVLTPDPTTDQDPQVIEIDDEEEIKGFINLLWAIVEYFDMGGSRHDKKRISITTKKGDKWEPREAGAE